MRCRGGATLAPAMPNRLTAVPARPVPAPGRLAALLLPVADLSMLALISRPATGSLRRTWVTPATLVLALAAAVIATASAILFGLRLGGGGIAASLGLAICVVIAAGAASVAVVGLDQRRTR